MAALGIDFGTAHVRVAVFRGREPELAQFPDGSGSAAAAVSLAKGTFKVGRAALARATTHPSETVRGIKRLLGRTNDDPVTRQIAERAAYEVTVRPEDGELALRLGGEGRSVVEVAAALLKHATEVGNAALGTPATHAILAAPYWFGPRQRRALLEAARSAGIPSPQVLSEATATALSLLGTSDRVIAIVDAGAGGFTASILEVGPMRVRLLASAGEALGGGDDLDAKLVRVLLRGLKGKHGDFPESPFVVEIIRQVCEPAKAELARVASAVAVIPYLPVGAGIHNQRVSIERETFDALLRDPVTRVGRVCTAALASAGIDRGRLEMVCATGGLTNIAAVRSAIERALGSISSKRLDPDGSVALGAAWHAGMLAGLADPVAILDVQTGAPTTPPPSEHVSVPPPRIHTPAPTPVQTTPPPSTPPVSSTRPSPPTSSSDGKRPSPGQVRRLSRATPHPDGPSALRAVRATVDPNAFRMELATLLAGLRAGAVTDAGEQVKQGRKTVARANEILEEDAPPPDVAVVAEQHAALWSTIAMAMQAARQYRWDHPQTERLLDKAVEEIGGALKKTPRSLLWDVGTTSLSYRGRPVWHPERPPFDRVPYELFVEGIRRLQIKPGLDRGELCKLLGVLARDAGLGFGSDDDAATALWDRHLPHVGYLAVDAFADGDDPEFQAARDAMASELTEALGAEGGLVRAYVEARREVAEVTRDLGLAARAREELVAAMDPPLSFWVQRFAAAFPAAEQEAGLAGRREALLAALSEWTEEQVGAGKPDLALELFAAIEEQVLSSAEAGAGALRDRVTAAMFPAPRVLAVLQGLRGATSVSDALAAGLQRVLELVRDASLVAAAIQVYADAPSGLREAIVGYVEQSLAGHEADVAALLPIAELAHARRLIAALATLGTPPALAAMGAGLGAASLEIRMEVFASLPRNVGEATRREVARLVADPSREVRVAVLRTVMQRSTAAAGPALAQRIEEKGFHDLDEVERALLLQALGSADRAKAEELAIGLLEEQHLFRSQNADQTRTIAADFLAGSESLAALDALQRIGKKRWFTSPEVRDAAARAADAVERRRATPRPQKLEKPEGKP